MCGTLESSGLGWRSWIQADPPDCCWVSSDTVNRVQVSCPGLLPKVAPGKQRYGRSRWLLRPQAVSKLRVKVKWGPAYGAGTEDSRAGVPSRSELSEGADEPAHGKERRLESVWGGLGLELGVVGMLEDCFPSGSPGTLVSLNQELVQWQKSGHKMAALTSKSRRTSLCLPG